MTEQELKEKLDGFLTDLESDIKQWGLTKPIRESAKVVILALIKEAGYVKLAGNQSLDSLKGRYTFDELQTFTYIAKEAGWRKVELEVKE